MAIIIQEEKSKSNIIPIVIAAVVVIGGGALSYYLFFSPTPAVDALYTEKYDNVTKISEVKLDIGSVTDSTMWKNLERGKVQPLPTSLPVRKVNPFQSL